MSKLPWVPRSLFEKTEHMALDYRRLLLEEQAKNERLVEEMLKLKRLGFRAPDPTPPEPVEPFEELPAEVRLALNARVNPDSRIGKLLGLQALAWLAAGEEPAQVAAKIYDGAE